ncbi:LysR family transcriptional regulator [Alloyangia pacifica]|uniref:LysR family transcriptional regulator n=1 Tax=Alloyangia pacifica TaxID=311180 RepID=UPI001CD3FD0B|nr:LysR family transcriptional regulator [Alloyangia pacifica]MCA0994868.1 LysR family transcriptional regulator [Alloyangia pacifica]
MISRNLRHLRVFLAVAEEAQITAAAERFNVSQPAVTQMLGKLETQAGGALFDRTSRGFILNERGTALAARLCRAFRQLDAALGAISPRLPALATSGQLQGMIAVHDTGSFTLAAKALDLAQPTVHRAVSQLEEEAGERLFERTPQGLIPSRTCSALVPRARLALSELDQADMDLGEIDGRETGRIAIGTLPLSRSVLLPRALAAFRQARPNMRVSVIDGTYEMLLAALRRGDVDLMLGALRSTQPAPDVVQEPLFHDRFAIVARPGHPLAGRGPLHPSELARFPWVVPGPGTQLRHQFEAIFAAHDLPLPASLIEAGFILLIREYLDLSDALAFTSGRQAAPELSRRNLVQLRVTENLPLRQIGLTMRVGWLASRPQQLMLDCLRAAAKGLPDL